jgi:DNA-binding CsgD family transcriptional regulator/PAS domain-containing protein
VNRRAPVARPGGPLAAFSAAAVLDAAGRLSAGCIVLTDGLGRIVWCDEGITRSLGLPAAALIGRRFEDLGHAVPVDRGQPRIAMAARPRTWIFRADLGGDVDPMLEIRAVPVFEPGAAEASATMLRVVPLRSAAERRAALRRAVEAVHADVCPVAVVGEDDRIRYANLRWTDLFGTGGGDPVGTSRALLGRDAPDPVTVAGPAGPAAATGERLVIAMDDVAGAALGVAPARRAAILREEGERHRRLWTDLAAVGLAFGDFDDGPPRPVPVTERRPRGGDADVLSRMTPRQREVLSVLAEGAANKEIAQRLGISVSTVKIHLRAIGDHLGTTNRIRAAGLAARLIEGVPA